MVKGLNITSREDKRCDSQCFHPSAVSPPCRHISSDSVPVYDSCVSVEERQMLRIASEMHVYSALPQ